MARAAPLSFEEVSRQIAYDPETGKFTWRVPKKGRPGIGSPAGCIHQTLGYWVIGVSRQRHYGHRLAWLLTHGKWPAHQIDHINGDRADNRIANLREVTHAENQQNRHITRPNRHGLRGVDYDPGCDRWRTRIKVNGVVHNFGGFHSPEEAHECYVRESRRLNPLTPV